MKLDKLEAVFETAFAYAIRKVGMAAFKRTSFFGSNDALAKDLKKAA